MACMAKLATKRTMLTDIVVVSTFIVETIRSNNKATPAPAIREIMTEGTVGKPKIPLLIINA